MNLKSRIALSLTCLAALSCVLSAEGPGVLAGKAGWKGAAPKSPDAFTFVVMSDRTGSHGHIVRVERFDADPQDCSAPPARPAICQS